jgi:uncharacterized protein (DUF433 family)
MTSGRITIDPLTCRGHACVTGTRIPVHEVLRALAHGETFDDLAARHPQLLRADIAACLDYAATLVEQQALPVEAADFEQ